MLSFAWKDFMLNTLTAVHSVIGIDIGKIGNVALSTGYQTIVQNEEDVHNLFRQIVQYGTTTIALELFPVERNKNRKRIKGLHKALDLIVKYCKIRTFAPINVVYIDEFKSSIICSNCKFVDRASRVEPWLFICTYCGNQINADVNAALNIQHAAEKKVEWLR